VGQARKKYAPEYRGEAVDLAVKSGRPIAEIARNLGINEATLGNWVLRAKQAGKVPETPEEPLGRGTGRAQGAA
jgi:transposase